jgi:hypothetical protein
MHLYLGKAKVANRKLPTNRFFIRSIIRHDSDLITKEASFEYLQNEGKFPCCIYSRFSLASLVPFLLGERLLLEAMGALEVAFSQHPS